MNGQLALSVEERGGHGGSTLDDLLRRTFLRHLAALVGTSRVDQDAIAPALAQRAEVDGRLVSDLAELTDIYIVAVRAAPDPEVLVLLRGHRSILLAVARTVTRTLRRRLQAQARRVARTLARLENSPL